MMFADPLVYENTGKCEPFLMPELNHVRKELRIKIGVLSRERL